LDGNLDCKAVLVGRLAHRRDLVKNELTFIFGSAVIEADLDVAARVNTNSLHSVVVAKLDLLAELRLNLNF